MNFTYKDYQCVLWALQLHQTQIENLLLADVKITGLKSQLKRIERLKRYYFELLQMSKKEGNLL